MKEITFSEKLIESKLLTHKEAHLLQTLGDLLLTTDVKKAFKASYDEQDCNLRVFKFGIKKKT